MNALERRWRAALARADLARSTGVRHAWRRGRRDIAFERTAAERRQSLSKSIWREAANSIGATMVDLSPVFAEIRRGEVRTWVMGQTTPLNDLVSIELAAEKPLVQRLLVNAGLPVPEHVVVSARDCSGAEGFLGRAAAPCVVKPSRGSGGEGVTGEVRRPQQLRRAAREASRYSSELLVERQAFGDLYRVLVLDGEILDVVRRRLPRVNGDGRSTVEELMFAEYDKRLAEQYDAPLKPFVVDLDCIFTLEAAGVRLDSVLPAGVSLAVKTVSNYNRPADNETIAAGELLQLQAEVVAAASAVGLRLAGVDVVTPSLDGSLSRTGGVVLEVNGRPALHHHRHVAQAENATAVAARILEVLLERWDELSRDRRRARR